MCPLELIAGLGIFSSLFGWFQKEKFLPSWFFFFKEKKKHTRNYKTTINPTLIAFSNPGEKQREGVDDEPRLRGARAGSAPRGQREQPANSSGGRNRTAPLSPDSQKNSSGILALSPPLTPLGPGAAKFQGALRGPGSLYSLLFNFF